MADTEDLVLSISADTRQMKRALDRLIGETDRRTKTVQRQFDDMSRGTQRSVEAMNNGFARSGATFQQSAKASAASVQNLRFQLNDIATGLASGQSPMTILAQQASQVTQALSGAGGLLGGIRLLGSALANPLTIATVAITTLAGLTSAYFRDTEKDAEAANKKMDEHRAAIKAAIDAWQGAPPSELLAYNAELEKLSNLEKQRAGLQAFISDTLKPVGVAADNVRAAFDEMFARLQARNADPVLLGNLQRDFDRITEAVKENRTTVADLEPLYNRLKEAEASLSTTRGFDQLTAAVSNMIALVRTLNGELKNTRDIESNLGKRTQELSPLGTLGPIRSEGGQMRFPATDPAMWNDQGKEAGENWMSGLYGYLSSGQAKSHIDNLNSDFASRLGAFLGSAPGRIEIGSGARSIGRQKELWEAALKKYGSAEAARKWVAPPGQSRHNSGEAADLKFASDSVREWAHANAEAYGLVFRLKNEDWHIELAREDAIKKTTTATKDSWEGLRKATTETKVATQDATEQYQAFGQVATTALNGLANALADGKIEGKELLQILIQVVQQLLTMPTSFLGGGKGGLLGGFLIPGILHSGGIAGKDGYGHGRKVSPGVFAGAQRYHQGGIAGIRAGEVPAILQKGERIIPKGGYGGRDGGTGGTVTLYVKGEEGPMFRPTIQAESKNVSVQVMQAGITKYDKRLDRTLGGKMANAQARTL